MADEVRLLEERMEQLSTQLRALTLRVERMSAHMGLAEEETPEPRAVRTPPTPLEASEEILSWADRKSLLSRASTVCFLLVVALILRTLTDSGLIDKQVGSFIGMGYAALLIAFGWFKYGQASPLAPVFSVCGAALMATVVLETHARFASLPTMPAYAILMLTGIATAVIGYLYRVAVPVIVGTLGLCLAGAAIDYPYPFFPLLGVLLLTANLLGTFATRIHRCSWLRWILLSVTLFMLALWATRLAAVLRKGSEIPPSLALPWFLPVIAVFMVTFAATSLLGIITSGKEKISKFDLALPTINVIWTFTTAQTVISAMGGSLPTHGIVGIAAALGHLGVCVWLAGQGEYRARGAGAFALAGSALLAQALPLALGSPLFPLPILGATAVGLSLVAHRWRRGGVRAVSYLLQAYACGSLAVLLRPEVKGDLVMGGGVVAAILASIAFFHYRWCRDNGPPRDSALFSRFDKGDGSAAFLLSASLFAFFAALRAGAWYLTRGGTGEAFHAAQSVIITASAAALVLLAYFRRNREVRNIAILVTLAGAVKVFLYDLLHLHGVPLMASIFSFGMAAAVESIVLGRWQLLTSRESVEERKPEVAAEVPPAADEVRTDP